MLKTISFVIPVYNEQKRIHNTISSLKNLKLPGTLSLERIIFVNDGSTDGTLNILNYIKDSITHATNAEVVIVDYKVNKGKGNAIREGMNYSNSDYTLFFDADMSTPLQELSKFIPYIDKEYDVIIGTRKNGESTVVVHQPRFRELMGKVFTLLSQFILDTHVTDFTCGFKAFSRKAKDEIFPRSIVNRWSYDAEILFIARKLELSMVEKSVLWSDDKNTKVKLIDAVYTSFMDLLRIRANDLFGKYRFSPKLRILSALRIANN